MDLPDKSVGGAVPPKKKIEPVIPGATQVPRPATRRFKEFLFAESPKVLAGRIGRDVVVPRIKAGLEEALNSFIAGMFWGDSANRPISSMVGKTVLRGGGTAYSAISSQPQALAMAQQANTARPSAGYEDLVVPTQQYAEILLSNMYELLNEYRRVSVGDLYELANISTQPSHNAYGWTSLDGARISKVRDGYLLELPRPTLV